MKFLIDHQLPPVLASFFVAKGYESKHVIDLKLETASDRRIWDLCLSENWILITKDEDFVHYLNLKNNSGQIIWVRMGNCRNENLIKSFESLLAFMISAIQDKESIIEIR